jgi:putative peptidoglycan lipid II flippase
MVKSLLNLLNARQTTILSGATVLMVAVFLSRFLGLIRDRLLVHNFSTSEASIFFAAFKLPDLMFQLLILGTLSVAFIPVFTEYLNKDGEKEAFSFASNILNLSLVVFGVLGLIGLIFVSQINNIFVPGFSGEQKVLTDQLTQIILVAQLILVVGSFFIGLSQSYQRFLVPALAPLFYNVGIIFGIAVLTPYFGIMGPAIGVIIGSLAHVLVQIPLIRSLGYRYTFSLNFLNKGVREVFKLMSVRNIGLAAEQISDAIGFALATIISFSAPTLLTFAQHLSAVPVGLFGATIAQAALPVLSREHAKGETESFKITLLTTMHQILFLTLPATAMLIVLRIPIVRLTFGPFNLIFDSASAFSFSASALAFSSLSLAKSLVLTLRLSSISFDDPPFIINSTSGPSIVSLSSKA